MAPVMISAAAVAALVTRRILRNAKVQVHADDSIQGGESLANKAQEEINAKLGLPEGVCGACGGSSSRALITL